MPGLYDTFRDVVQWERFIAESDEVPGLERFDPAVAITVRDKRKIAAVGGDLIADRIVWTFPADEVNVGDKLDGHRVERVETPEDAAGIILFRVCYVAG